MTSIESQITPNGKEPMRIFESNSCVCSKVIALIYLLREIFRVSVSAVSYTLLPSCGALVVL